MAKCHYCRARAIHIGAVPTCSYHYKNKPQYPEGARKGSRAMREWREKKQVALERAPKHESDPRKRKRDIYWKGRRLPGSFESNK